MYIPMNVPSHMMEPMTEPVNRFRHNCNVTLRLSSFNCILFDRGILMGIVLQLGYHWSLESISEVNISPKNSTSFDYI